MLVKCAVDNRLNWCERLLEIDFRAVAPPKAACTRSTPGATRRSGACTPFRTLRVVRINVCASCRPNRAAPESALSSSGQVPSELTRVVVWHLNLSLRCGASSDHLRSFPILVQVLEAVVRNISVSSAKAPHQSAHESRVGLRTVAEPQAIHAEMGGNIVEEHNEIINCAGAGLVGWISTEDIAEVAFKALTVPMIEHTNPILVGPELLSYAEIVKMTRGMSPEYAELISALDLTIAQGAEEQLYKKADFLGTRKLRDFLEANNDAEEWRAM
ncbi:hypothetical protein B0H11DRAFT_2240996 [Mycena galericulata]|nr:hypothetical protein B0H11DRAFT_2240996 [Mycena galericulata]